MGILEDKTCIVTGAAGSLGLASTCRFVAEGARVMLVDSDRSALDAALKSLPEGRATAMLADVAEAKSTAAYITATVARWGPIDVLFSNAGISGVVQPVEDYPEDTFDRVLAVNLKGAFLACKYGLPQMREGGSIIMTASVVGVTSDPGISAYAASKHGLIGLMRTVAKEAAARQVRVNVVAPGPIDNSFQRDVENGLTRALGTDAGRLLDSIIPLGRHARAEEVAELVLFLASDRSAFTTGTVLMAEWRHARLNDRWEDGMEFWRDLKPIERVFQPDALPEVYIHGAATDDDRYYVPFTETVFSRPLWISPSQNKWCDILMARSAGLVNRHYHPHEVFAYTISGRWSYLEHDWIATRGDFVYETPGESHTLVAHDHPDPMKVFFIVKGPLVWLDEQGQPDGYFDVHQYIALCKAHYDKVGLGAAAIDKLYR